MWPLVYSLFCYSWACTNNTAVLRYYSVYQLRVAWIYGRKPLDNVRSLRREIIIIILMTIALIIIIAMVSFFRPRRKIMRGAKLVLDTSTGGFCAKKQEFRPGKAAGKHVPLLKQRFRFYECSRSVKTTPRTRCADRHTLVNGGLARVGYMATELLIK